MVDTNLNTKTEQTQEYFSRFTFPEVPTNDKRGQRSNENIDLNYFI